MQPKGDNHEQVRQQIEAKGTGWDTILVNQAIILRLKKSTRNRSHEKKRTGKKGAEIEEVHEEKRKTDRKEKEKKKEIEKENSTRNVESEEKRKRKRETEETTKENRKKSVVRMDQKTHIQRPGKSKRKPCYKAPKESILKYLVRETLGPPGTDKTSGEDQEPGDSSSNPYNIIVKSKSEASPLGIGGGNFISTTACKGGLTSLPKSSNRT